MSDRTPLRGGLVASPLGRVAAAALDSRLERNSPAPLVVAFSGGGDSLALLLIASAWARSVGRPLIAVTVDHQLQPASAEWAEWCARRCERLVVDHLAVRWEGTKPVSGVAAAARLARHRLLAQAARSLGARVVLMGHTADDLHEAALMRAAGATTPSPLDWSPSPVWPDGAGVFLARPLLGASRAALRGLLLAAGEAWIDDPANEDPRSLRARVRLVIAQAALAPCELCATRNAPATVPPATVEIGAAGEIRLDRARWSAAPPVASARCLALAVACASGAEALPRGAQAARLAQRLTRTSDVAVTLGGARVIGRDDHILVVRETSDGRQGTASLRLRGPGEAVWDGRFRVRTRQDAGLTHAAGAFAHLPRALRDRLRLLDPAARGAVPLAAFAHGDLAAPTLAPDARLSLTPLVAERFFAAAGAFQHESAMVEWRNDRRAPRSEGSVTRLDYESA